jgi:hypothetical protein
LQIFHLPQLLVGKKIVQRQSAGIARVARTELRSGMTRKPMPRMFHDQIGRQTNEFLGDLYDGYRRGGQTQPRSQSCA